MRKIIFFLIVYSILVLLGGTMSFWHGKKFISLFFEIFGGILLFGSVYFLTKEKKIVHLFVAFIATVLLVYYGYFFYTTTGFFEGVMAAVSAFVAFSNVMEYFK
jgi:uncharacterized membrane protein (UPF0136 family)